MTTQYKDKVILITGTSKGIGYELTKRLLQKNATVFGISRSDAHIKHDRYHHIIGDVTHSKSVMNLVGEIRKKAGRLDILINNAGVANMNTTMLTPEATVKHVMETNFLGTFNVCRECAKLMIRHRYGRIINFSSIASPLNLEGEAVYASSKAAIEKFTKILAKELSIYNITVNCVGPSPVMTDLIKNVPVKKIDDLVNRMIIKKMCTYDDIQNVIDFFLNDDSDKITGQTLYIGGTP